MSSTPAVELRGIGKRFPGVIANYDVDLNVRAGTIHAIVGENGAGKSTLMKTLYGMQEPDSGTISVEGTERRFKSPSDAINAGIGMVHQHFMLADNLTVLENIILGSEPGRRGIIDDTQARTRIADIMSAISTDLDLDMPVSELGVGERQRVEIVKVLYRGARILILDEPTAVLVPEEVDELFVTLSSLVNDGATVIFISHKLDEVLQVSNDITVMRQGTTVAETTPENIDRSGLAELMVGSELPHRQEGPLTLKTMFVSTSKTSPSWASKGALRLTAHRSPYGQAKLLGSLELKGMDSTNCAQRSLALCHHLARSLLTAPTSRKQPPGSDMMRALPTSRLTVTERGSC